MAKEMDANLRKALDAALGKIEKDHGKGAIMVGEDYHMEVKDVISTGALSLDIALGIGGLPLGRIVEIYGPESSGKTTLCYEIIASAQKMGGMCAFIDTEHAVDPVYAKNVGVDMDNLLLAQPDSAEQALNIASTLVESGAISVLVLDSVAALVPKAELQGEVGDSFVGLQARIMGQAIRRLAGSLNRNQTLMVFTNQIREKIGVMFGSPETQPGGRALKFAASVRMDIRRIETIKEGTDAVANKVRVKMVKNKMASPFKQVEFEIRFGEGIDNVGILLDMAVENKLLHKAGAYVKMNGAEGNPNIQGRASQRVFLLENPEYANQLNQKVRDIVLTKQKPGEKVENGQELDLPGM